MLPIAWYELFSALAASALSRAAPEQKVDCREQRRVVGQPVRQLLRLGQKILLAWQPRPALLRPRVEPHVAFRFLAATWRASRAGSSLGAKLLSDPSLRATARSNFASSSLRSRLAARHQSVMSSEVGST